MQSSLSEIFWKLAKSGMATLFVFVTLIHSSQTRRVEANGSSLTFEEGHGELPVLDDSATLADYLAYAAIRNPGLESAFHQWRAAMEKVSQVSSLPDPRFNYAYFIREVETRVGPQRHRFGLSQTLPWAGKRDLRGAVANEAAEAARQRYEAEKLKLFFQVKDAYYEYYFLGRAIRISRENMDLLRHWEEVARSQYTVGEAQYADVVRAQVELGKLDDQLRTLEELQGPLAARLNAELNRPVETAIAWPDAIPNEQVVLSREQLAVTLGKSNPELRALDAEVSRQQKAMELAHKDLFPDFTVGFDYIGTAEGINPADPDNGKDPFVAMFSINIPLWRDKYRAGEREAESRRQAAQSSRKDKENVLSADVSFAAYHVEDAERKIRLYRDTLIPKAEQSLRATASSFEAGKLEFLSIIDAQRILLEFQLAFERALSRKAQQIARLEMLLGIELPRAETEASLKPLHLDALQSSGSEQEL